MLDGTSSCCKPETGGPENGRTGRVIAMHSLLLQSGLSASTVLLSQPEKIHAPDVQGKKTSISYGCLPATHSVLVVLEDVA